MIAAQQQTDNFHWGGAWKTMSEHKVASIHRFVETIIQYVNQ